jgi:hypothetical protein
MEGKGVLFKRFADIDVFDIELDTEDPEEIIRTVKLLEPTFGGINLEDIKAPECFEIEERLKEEMKIPVFHDDQHGTAIISAPPAQRLRASQGKRSARSRSSSRAPAPRPSPARSSTCCWACAGEHPPGGQQGGHLQGPHRAA